MNHVFWQIDKIRKGLNQYRLVSAVNCDKPSWADVCNDVIECKAIYAHPDQSLEPEALRRFASGKTKSSGPTMNRLRDFLIHEKILDPADFKNETEAFSEMAFALNYLGSNSVEAENQLKQIKTRYRSSTIKRTARFLNIELKVTKHETYPLIYVEEWTEASSRAPGRFKEYAKDQNRMLNGRRKGYGFFATSINQLCIVVRGPAKTDVTNYFQLPTNGSNEQDFDLLLVKLGDDGSYIEVGKEPNLRRPYMFSSMPDNQTDTKENVNDPTDPA